MDTDLSLTHTPEAHVDRNAYGTPPYIIEAIRAALGGTISLDPASNAKAQARVRATQWCGPDHPEPGMREGLCFDCANLEGVFLNPPYGRGLVAPWVYYLRYHTPASWCVLTNAVTSTEWSRTLFDLSDGVVLLDHRVAFLHPLTGQPCKGNSHDQMITFGGNVDPTHLRTLGKVFTA